MCCLYSHRKLFFYWLSTVSIQNLKRHFMEFNMWRYKFQFFTQYWHSRTVTEPSILSWIQKEKNSTVILNCQSRLIKNYLPKGFHIIEQGTKQLSFLPNDVRLRIILNNQLDTDYVVVKNKAIPAVENTIKQLHIQKDMLMIYKLRLV